MSFLLDTLEKRLEQTHLVVLQAAVDSCFSATVRHGRDVDAVSKEVDKHVTHIAVEHGRKLIEIRGADTPPDDEWYRTMEIYSHAVVMVRQLFKDKQNGKI